MNGFSRLMKLASIVALLMLVIPVAGAQDDGITLVPFSSDYFGVTGLIPDGWEEASPGVYVQPADANGQQNILLIQSLPMSLGDTEALLMSQFQMAALPEVSETLQTDMAEWQLRTFDIEVADTESTSTVTIVMDLALAEIDGTSYIVLVQAYADATDMLHEAVFVPVLENLTKVELPETADYVNPDSFTETEHVFGFEGWELPGTLTMPNGDGPFPVAVLVHGSGPHDRNEALGKNTIFRDIAQGLASQGIAVFRYDKRTFVYGAEISVLDEFDLDDETTDDALAALEYVRGLDKIDSEKSFIIGHSQGAMVAPRMAEQDPQLAGIIMIAGPARNFEDILYSQVAYQESLDDGELSADARASLDALLVMADGTALLRAGEDASEKFPAAGTRYYWQSIVDYDQVATAQSLDLPMLFLQGERDYQVTMEDFALWQEALADKDNVTFISYPTLHHMLFASGDLSELAVPANNYTADFADPQLVSDIIDWIKAQ